MGKRSGLHGRMRTYHRYLGFFLAGVMAVYAVSGMILIFRDVDFLKKEVIGTRQLGPGLGEREVGEAIRVRDLRFGPPEGDVRPFKQGRYDARTGLVEYTEKRYPFVIDKLTHLHKANTKDPLFFLNVFFGISLLFFVVSAFWMFFPGTAIFKKGMWFTLAGVLLVLVMLLL